MVEVIDDSSPITVTLKDPVPPPDCYTGETQLQNCPDGSTIITHTCVDGKWKATGNKCPDDPTPDCYAGETKTKGCPDGSTIITHTCVNEKWNATGNVCPDEPTPDCYAWETKSKLCSDGSSVITHTCVAGKWKATGNTCPTDDDETNWLLYIGAGIAALGIYFIARRR